ncbi:MAG: polysaccharide deacetylase family protein [Elusimicrobiota bacterium]|nr:MAG: polysaccharide deacetylase family protein [Elusimicrobiota bacterium]
MTGRALALALDLGLDRPLRWLRRRSAVVLMYHGFTDRPSDGIVNYQGNRLQQSAFRRQLSYLRDHANLVTLRAVVESLRGGPALPDNAVALTIDDGYESVHSLGFPVLREFSAPAALFVATQFVDERVPLWPDRLEHAFAGAPGDAAARRERLKSLQAQAKDLLPRAREALIVPVERELRRLVLDGSAPENYRPLSWAQCREMADSGLVEIGSHTHTHTIATLLGASGFREELARSKALVEKNVGRPCDLFCYPNGDYDDLSADTAAALRDGGFLCGLSTVAGFVGPGADPYALRRFGTDDRDSFDKFRMTFSLGRNLLQGARRRLSNG